MSKTNYRAGFTGGSLRKKALIGALILAILAGSFIVQTKFIASENKQLVESLANSIPSAEQNAEIAPAAKNDTPNLEMSRTDAAADLPQNLAAPKNVQAVKVVLKGTNRQTENKPAQNSLKNEIKRDPKAERLRRAEKILTGF